MALRRELLQQIAVDITDILQSASDDQIKELFDNLKVQNKKLQEQYINLDPLQLYENRQKRMVKRMKYWISAVTRDQRDAVSAWSSQLAPIAEEWLRNRELVQAEARRLLARAKSDPASEKSLQELIADPERMRTAAYQKAIEINTDFRDTQVFSAGSFALGIQHIFPDPLQKRPQRRFGSCSGDPAVWPP